MASFIMLSFLNRSALVLGLGCAFVAGRLAYSSRAHGQTNQESEAARKAITPILADPLYMRLDTRRMLWQIGDFNAFDLPDEAPLHPQGVFQMVHTHVSPVIGTLPDSYSVSSYGWSHISVFDFDRLPSRKQCQENSRAFIKNQFPWFFTPQTTPHVRVEEPIWDSEERRGVRFFHWTQENEEGLPRYDIKVSVRATDGKVVEYSAMVRGWIEHRASYRNAEKEALRLASTDTNVTSIEVTDQRVFLCADDSPKALLPLLPRALFRIDLEGLDKTTHTSTHASFYFDADTGKSVWLGYLSGKHLPKRANWVLPHSDLIGSPPDLSVAAFPLWANNKLVFVSSRPMQKCPVWAPPVPQLALLDAQGRTTHDAPYPEFHALNWHRASF